MASNPSPALERNDLATWIEERNNALRGLDLAYIKRALGRPEMTDEMALLTLHKSRYEVKTLPDAMRYNSRAWLAKRGYKRMDGSPLLPEGELPK